MTLLDVQNLSVNFETRHGTVHAVRDVSWQIGEGETFGLVGESGSGKSVSAMSLLGLLPSPPAKLVSGTAVFDGTDLYACSSKEMRQIRGSRIAMIFQDPMTSLNPHMRLDHQLIEALLLHQKISRRDAIDRAVQMLERVGIADASKRIRSFPHQFSGGMRQRVMIAMAMLCAPKLLIADEPTTALDVTLQRAILDLIRELQQETGMAVLFISHDLGVIGEICSRIAVMRKGEVVETGETHKILTRPEHVYTQGLLNCLPSLHPPGTRLQALEEST